MIVSNKYTKIERNGMYYIIPSSAPECPHCGGCNLTEYLTKRTF